LADNDTAGSGDAVRGGGFCADLSGRTAVVTGASSGLGRAIAELLLANGASVIGLQRRTDVQLGGDYTAVAADLADAASIAGVVEGILAEHEVHILVNNAGINIRHRFEEFPLEDFDRVMQVNLRAVVELTQLFARPMLERGSGTVINIASMLSFTGGYTAAAYATSKGAVGQLTKTLSNEWAARGVRVNAIAPGFIDTEMNTALRADETRDRQIRERIPYGRWGRAEDIAGAALFLASPAAEYVHGVVLPVDGGYLGR
jgi:2-deoxy-D-gluconate 3-dehydrogenase